jgi:hypothetical protein
MLSAHFFNGLLASPERFIAIVEGLFRTPAVPARLATKRSVLERKGFCCNQRREFA